MARQQTFFSDEDCTDNRDLLGLHCAVHGVAVWSWVLMPNHVHLILVPEQADALRAVLSKVHHAYARRIDARERRTGHFWQARFGCVAMDEPHPPAALRYVALNALLTLSTGRCEHGWCSGPRTGAGPASMPCSIPGAVMD